MKTVKNFIAKFVLVIGIAAGMCAAVEKAEAIQPVVWTLNLTNASLPSIAVNTVQSNSISSATWTSGSATSFGYVDTLQSTVATISTWYNFAPTGTMGGNTANGVTTYWQGSQDLTSWVPWTNSLAFVVPGTTNQFASYLRLDTSPFRYIAPVGFIYSVTNGAATNVPTSYTNALGALATNTQVQIKVQLKGP